MFADFNLAVVTQYIILEGDIYYVSFSYVLLGCHILYQLVFDHAIYIVGSIAYRNVMPSFDCTKIANRDIKVFIQLC